jgi:hypothetical protein
MQTDLKIKDAEYLQELTLKITFSDSTEKIVDFSSFLMHHSHPQHDAYRDPQQFKKYSIVSGNIVWGKDWDMVFPVEDIYNGKLTSF